MGPVVPRGAPVQVVAAAAEVGGVVVADRAQPVPQPDRESQSALSWLGKRVRNRRLIAESMSRNSPTAPGKVICRWARSWLAIATRACDQVLAGPHRHPQRDGCLASRVSGRSRRPVGAQHVSQHVGVEPVVLVAGRAVAAAQALDLVRGDHQHGQTRPRAARRPPARRDVRSRPRTTPARCSRRSAGAARPRCGRR